VINHPDSMANRPDSLTNDSHGISIYGWQYGDDAGFASRHPTLISGKATIRLRSEGTAAISDDELRDFVRAALAG
jgi:hypothetical protein